MLLKVYYWAYFMEEVVFARKASGLVRELGFQDAFIWSIATPAASGITFYSVRMAFTYPGSNAALSFLIASLIILPITITLGIMSATMPRSGGMYVQVSRVLGSTIGVYAAWIMVIGWGIAMGLLGYIVTGILGSALVMVGYAGGGAGFISAGSAMATQLWQTVGGIVFTLFFWIVSLYGLKYVKWIERILFYLPLVATILAILLFIGIGPGGVSKMFDSVWGEGVYMKILNAARDKGWGFPGFSWSATIASLIVPFWAWTGFEAVTFASGEVRDPKRSLVYGFIGGYIGCMILYTVVAWAVYYPYQEFIGAYVFLANKHPDVLTGIMPAAITPSVPFFAASLSGNLILGAIIAVLIALWYANSIPPVFVSTSRTLFALAFDRAFPLRLSEVNERGCPTWASHVTMIWGIVGVFVAAFSVDIILGILDFTMLNFFWLMGLSALLLPFIRPEIYKMCPIQGKIAGIPLLSILGLISFAIGFWIVCFSILEFTYSVAAVMAVFLAIGFIIHAWQYSKNVKEGIDVSKIYTVLPPT
jgi:amino acid transporter